MHRSPAPFSGKWLFSTASRRFWTIQIIYLMVSCLFLFFYACLPKTNRWLTTTIQSFYNQRQDFGEQTDLKTRKLKGYGEAYTYTELIRKHCTPDDYFLIPPQRYLIRKAYRQGQATGFAWIYPSVLYYHLGKSVHLLELVNPDLVVQRATFTFWVAKNQLALLRLTDQNRPSVLAEFRKYDPHFFAYTPQQAQAYYKSSRP